MTTAKTDRAGLNPACTKGTTTGSAPSVTGHCGCGWTVTGFPSKRQALKAQKAHRFPSR